MRRRFLKTDMRQPGEKAGGEENEFIYTSLDYYEKTDRTTFLVLKLKTMDRS